MASPSVGGGGQAAAKVILHVLGCKSFQYGMFEDNLVALTGICRERGYTSRFVFPNDPPAAEFTRDIATAGGGVMVVPDSDRGDTRGLRAISRAIRTTRPAVVHAHFGRPGYVAVAAAKALGVDRIFLTKHHESWPAISRGHAAALRALAMMADRIFCVSEIVLKEVLYAGVPENKALVTLFGVSGDRFRPDPEAAPGLREELQIPSTARMVLCAAHLRVPKGMDVLIEAWDRLGRSPSEAVLAIAGDGPLGPELRAQAAAMHSGARVDFLGMRNDMPRLLAGTDVFVCPSLSEAGGFVVMEALCAAAPTVATKTGMALSLVDRDLFVPVRQIEDPGALADALARILSDDRARVEMGRRARDYVTRELSLESRMTALADAYEMKSVATVEGGVLA